MVGVPACGLCTMAGTLKDKARGGWEWICGDVVRGRGGGRWGVRGGWGGEGEGGGMGDGRMLWAF